MPVEHMYGLMQTNKRDYDSATLMGEIESTKLFAATDIIVIR